MPPSENIFLSYIAYTSLYIYNSNWLEYIVVCTATATLKNAGSGFWVRVRVVGFIPLLQEGQLLVTDESMCMKHWLTAHTCHTSHCEIKSHRIQPN